MMTAHDTWRPAGELWDDRLSHRTARSDAFDSVNHDNDPPPAHCATDPCRLPCDRLTRAEIDPGSFE